MSKRNKGFLFQAVEKDVTYYLQYQMCSNLYKPSYLPRALVKMFFGLSLNIDLLRKTNLKQESRAKISHTYVLHSSFTLVISAVCFSLKRYLDLL